MVEDVASVVDTVPVVVELTLEMVEIGLGLVMEETGGLEIGLGMLVEETVGALRAAVNMVDIGKGMRVNLNTRVLKYTDDVANSARKLLQRDSRNSKAVFVSQLNR